MAGIPAYVHTVDRVWHWRPGPPVAVAGAGKMTLELLKKLNGYE